VNDIKVQFVCPEDRVALVANEHCLHCPECHMKYSIENGVVRFLKKNDDFYEGAYEAQVNFSPRNLKLFNSWPLWIINSGFLWNIKKFVTPGSRLLELGCGGGVLFLANYYRTIGCDLSFSSLKKISSSYDYCIQADATIRLPFADSSLDAVASSFFWEHFTMENKKSMIKELYRILRPGGVLVFLYDVETQNPLISYFKRKDRDKYKKLFQDGDGHVGYHSPQANLDVFRNSGFSIVKSQGIEKTWLQSPSVYKKLLKYNICNIIFKMPIKITENRCFFYLYSLFLRVVDETVGRIFPLKWARIHLVVCRKEL
jgi:ubiquinone/menaquinone biosynthesis C-methylase UbiE